VHLLSDYTGRGPATARTTIDRDVVVILLSDRLTADERMRVEAGEAEEVLDARHDFQNVMREGLVELVERETERTVVAFMSDNHIAPDLSVEVFVLER